MWKLIGLILLSLAAIWAPFLIGFYAAQMFSGVVVFFPCLLTGFGAIVGVAVLWMCWFNEELTEKKGKN